MKLKTIDTQVDGKTATVAVLDDKGHPVYIHDDGKEVGHDAKLATDKIKQLNGEAQGHREVKEAAEAKLLTFAGIEDAAAAVAALATVANLNSGELTTAAKVQEIKDAAARAAEDRVAAAVAAKDADILKVTGERDGFKGALDSELIGGGFSRSKYIADKISIPADIMQATFGSRFKVEDGKLVAYGPDAKQLYSRSRPGEVADLDEALELLVDGYANKDLILKATIGGGGGALPGGGGNGGGTTIKREAFFKLPPAEQAAKAKDAAAGKIKIVD